MDYFVLIALFLIAVFIFYKNIKTFSNRTNNKKYIDICNSVLFLEDDAYDKVCEYLKNEKDDEYINKAIVLKLFVELSNELDYSETLNALNIKAVYYKNDSFIKSAAIKNSDTFIVLMLIIIKAIMQNKVDVAQRIMAQLDDMHDLDNYVEYLEVLDINNTLLENKEPKFLFELINGEYSKYTYEKNMVLLYKRIAAATLSYKKLGYDLYFEEDLKYFAQTAVGGIVLKDYNLFDKYKVKEN